MLEPPPLPVPHSDDEPDSATDEEPDLGSVEEHKSVILHLLQQLKLGMDLTRVVLPTFILEKRSLLERFADSMLHPDMFLRPADMPDPESRMVAVLEWYLTSFHAGRKFPLRRASILSSRSNLLLHERLQLAGHIIRAESCCPQRLEEVLLLTLKARYLQGHQYTWLLVAGALAKKPYNPLIGETFHCSWNLGGGGENRLVYTAEQVSHHPPVTAFYLECPQKQVWLNSSIYTKSKFMGMSIGVNMVGRMQLHLMRHDEVYNMQLPSAYARSILTVPWVELGDKVTISCPKSRYSAAVVFHTKPFYGGRLHRVSAEVRNPASSVVCRVSGEWSGQLEFDYPALGVKKVLDVAQLPVTPKRVRPKQLQRPYESRRIWGAVTDALRSGDIGRATEESE
uniref:Oxysterol-binding protein n=1 Tax=Macrostomum lignano TaxID=282301 RepID=A0A1I8IXM6_9PLAT